MRSVVILLALVSSAAASPRLPDQECSPSFVRQWMSDKESALGSLPSRPCIMRTKSGPYVCYNEGCVRTHVYLDSD